MQNDQRATPLFLGQPSHLNTLISVLKNLRSSLKLCVENVTSHQLTELLVELSSRNVDIRVLSTHYALTHSRSKLNLERLARHQSRAISMRALNTKVTLGKYKGNHILNSQYILIDDSISVIGVWKADCKSDLMTMIEDKSIAAYLSKHFNNLWHQACEIVLEKDVLQMKPVPSKWEQKKSLKTGRIDSPVELTQGQAQWIPEQNTPLQPIDVEVIQKPVSFEPTAIQEESGPIGTTLGRYLKSLQTVSVEIRSQADIQRSNAVSTSRSKLRTGAKDHYLDPPITQKVRITDKSGNIEVGQDNTREEINPQVLPFKPYDPENPEGLLMCQGRDTRSDSPNPQILPFNSQVPLEAPPPPELKPIKRMKTVEEFIREYRAMHPTSPDVSSRSCSETSQDRFCVRLFD